MIALQLVQKEKLSDNYNSTQKELIQPAPVIEAPTTPAEVLQTEMPPVVPEPVFPIVEEKPITVPTEAFKPSVTDKDLEDKQKLIENELLSIINKINVLQRDLDSLGEDIIKFSNLYKVEVKEKNSELIPSEPVIQEIPKEPKIFEGPKVSGEIVSENISPFSLGENVTNIFD